MRIELNSNSVRNAIITIQEVQRNYKKVNLIFRNESLKWISNRANEILDRQKNPYPIASQVRNSWVIDNSLNNLSVLTNTCQEGAYIEFGTGYEGELSPHDLVAKGEVNYEYNVPSQAKAQSQALGHGDTWTFILPNTGIRLKFFGGYEGHAFLYKAFREFVDTKVYAIIYENVIKTINRGVIV